MRKQWTVGLMGLCLLLQGSLLAVTVEDSSVLPEKKLNKKNMEIEQSAGEPSRQVGEESDLIVLQDEEIEDELQALE